MTDTAGNSSSSNSTYQEIAQQQGMQHEDSSTCYDGRATNAEGRIVFASNSGNNSNYQIYTMNADGTSLKRLTNNPTNDAFPSGSPDGKKIAFTRGANVDEINNNINPAQTSDSPGIYIMNADGTGLTRLTDNNMDIQPSWSPDGKKIVFVKYVIEFAQSTKGLDGGNNNNGNILPTYGLITNREIYTMNAADGSNQTRLTHNSAIDDSPSWSPDGKKIVFVRFEVNKDGPTKDAEIYTRNAADGSNQTRLTYGLAPHWSSTGVTTSSACNLHNKQQ